MPNVGIPSRRWPRHGFIRPKWQRVCQGLAWPANWWPRQREFGPTDANMVLFSPEDTCRHSDRHVRWLRRDESHRRTAPLLQCRTATPIPP